MVILSFQRFGNFYELPLPLDGNRGKTVISMGNEAEGITIIRNEIINGDAWCRLQLFAWNPFLLLCSPAPQSTISTLIIISLLRSGIAINTPLNG